MTLHQFNRKVYDSYLDNSSPWLDQAGNLRRAADEILNTGIPAPNSFWRIPVWNLLIGLSFENLVKGLLIAHGIPAGAGGKFSKDFKTHKFSDLLRKLAPKDCKDCDLANKETKICDDFQESVEWGGRYPVSVKLQDFSSSYSFSTGDYNQTIGLWDRLFAHIGNLTQSNKSGSTAP